MWFATYESSVMYPYLRECVKVLNEIFHISFVSREFSCCLKIFLPVLIHEFLHGIDYDVVQGDAI